MLCLGEVGNVSLTPAHIRVRFWPMRTLSVNLDHVATLREARKEPFPDPVQAAVLAELGGADGITVHLRSDRRHIKERDLMLLRQTIKTELNLEMAPTQEMVQIAAQIKPDLVTLVPEEPGELTTGGGLALAQNLARIKETIQPLFEIGSRISVFIEAEAAQIEAAHLLRAHQVELNTDRYAREPGNRKEILTELERTAKLAHTRGLVVHAGHGLNYQNIVPILSIKEMSGFSIGFAIVARALMVGMRDAVSDLKHLIEVYG